MHKQGHFLPCGSIIGMDSVLWREYLTFYVREKEGGVDSAETTPAATAPSTRRLLRPAVVAGLSAAWLALWLALVVLAAA